jgi:integrase/recombinase XerD
MKAALQLGNQSNKNGLYEIYIRISDNGKMKRIKANIAVEKRQFKSKNHNMKWIVNHPNHSSLNSDLRLLISKYDDIVFSSSVKNKILTPELVLHKIKKGIETESVVKFWEVKMVQMLNYNHRKGYRQSLNNWNEFTSLAKLGDLNFKQIDVYILKEFENYMLGKGLKTSTVYTNLKRLRSIFNMAIKEQVISVGDYIFKAYTMPKANSSKKERLTQEELKEFAKIDYKKNSLHKTIQQAFLLAVNLAGIRIEDALTLKWSYIKNERISYTMEKTDSITSFKITLQIQDILDYFKSLKTNSIYIIPILKDGIEDKPNEIYKKEIGSKTALMNKYLKLIADDACIDKRITTHTARHTFASIAYKKTGGNVEFVKNALKHKDAKITQIYLDSLNDDSLDDTMIDVTNNLY